MNILPDELHIELTRRAIKEPGAGLYLLLLLAAQKVLTSAPQTPEECEQADFFMSLVQALDTLAEPMDQIFIEGGQQYLSHLMAARRRRGEFASEADVKRRADILRAMFMKM